MNRTDAPKKQPVVFGTNGQRENLPDTTPAGDNTASYDAGFPAVTMILKSAGGLPPKGQDMNQILFELSAIGRWLSAGALNAYDATFSSAVGGYPKASVIVGDDGSSIYISTVDANTNNPNSTPTGWLSLAKVTAIAALAGGADKLPYFTGANTAAQTDLTSVGRDIIGKSSTDDVLTYLGLGNTKYGAPLIGQLIEWPLQKMPHEIWPDMGQEYIPYMAQSFDPVKYPLLSQLHPTNVLPADMRGYGVRGWDNARGVDTGRALMSAQSSGAPNLTGTVQNVVGILGAGSTGAALGWTPGGVSSTAKSGTDSGVISIVMDASISSKEYQAITEVRSKNVAWNMIVRAK